MHLIFLPLYAAPALCVSCCSACYFHMSPIKVAIRTRSAGFLAFLWWEESWFTRDTNCIFSMSLVFTTMLIKMRQWYCEINNTSILIFVQYVVKGMVKDLPLLRGACRSLSSKAGIAAPAKCHSYCIEIYCQINSRPLFPTTGWRTVLEYWVLLPIISKNKSWSH